MRADRAAPDVEGRVLGGRYRLLRQLGTGGMGSVWLCEHVVLGRRYAVKVLNVDRAAHPEAVERFRQEARAASRITQENVVDVFDSGEDAGGEHYYVMEVLEGRSVAQVLREDGLLTVSRALLLLEQVCRALAAAHGRGVIHCDVKPDNVLVERLADGSERAKLIDFGISRLPGAGRLTRDGEVIGTPEYMSPEQAAGDEVDARTDVYTAGVLAFELLTGLPAAGRFDRHRHPGGAPDQDPGGAEPAPARAGAGGGSAGAAGPGQAPGRPVSLHAGHGSRGHAGPAPPRPGGGGPARAAALRIRGDHVASRRHGADGHLAAGGTTAGCGAGATTAGADAARASTAAPGPAGDGRFPGPGRGRGGGGPLDRASPGGNPGPPADPGRGPAGGRRAAPTGGPAPDRRGAVRSGAGGQADAPPSARRGAGARSVRAERHPQAGSLPMSRPLLIASAVLALLLAAPSSAADDVAEARAHFDQGSKLYRAGKYRDAIVEFEAAYRLKPHGAIHYNVAQCREKLEHWPEALRSYQDYLREVPDARDRAAVRATMGRIERRLAAAGVQALLVYTDPPGAALRIDGKPRGRTPYHVALAPGVYRLSLALSGYEPEEQEVEVSMAGTRLVDVVLRSRVAAPVGASTPATPPPVTASTSPALSAALPASPPATGALAPDLAARPPVSPVVAVTPAPPGPVSPPAKRRVYTWVAAGVAVAAGAAGVAYGVAASRQADKLRDGTVHADAASLASGAQSKATTANVLYGVSGVAAAAGVTLFFVEGKF